MSSCLLLETAGRWRIWGIAAIFLIAALPSVPLLSQAVASLQWEGFSVGEAFSGSLWNSAIVALAAIMISLAVGLPGGVVAALYKFPLQKLLLILVALPLLVPSFLWAIGWSSLAASGGRRFSEALSGFPGSILVFCGFAIPLVLLTVFVAASGVSASQIEAARLAGGEATVFGQTMRHALQPALLAASLAGVLTLSDPGPGFILGPRSAASEILTSFSALYNFPLAGRQCALLAGLVLLLAAPLAYYAAPRLAVEVMPRQLLGKISYKHRGFGWSAVVLFLILIAFNIVLPLTGLALPLTKGGQFERAFSELLTSLPNTLLYASGAGLVAVLTGLLLSFLVGRSSNLRMICLGICLVMFSLPPSLGALGLVQLAAGAPPWTDPFLRSRLTVAVALGLRFFPVAVLLGLQAWAATSPSWTWAAAVHGVSVSKYLRKVLLPVLTPALALSVVFVALLASADVGTVLLVHPPGRPSFPLVVFTLMANAPESLVASLCVLYVVAAAGLLALTVLVFGKDKQ